MKDYRCEKQQQKEQSSLLIKDHTFLPQNMEKDSGSERIMIRSKINKMAQVGIDYCVHNDEEIIFIKNL